MMDFVDPYDLLQEHDLNIQRLIKANNAQQQTINSLVKQQEHFIEVLQEQQQRIQLLERHIGKSGL